MIGIHDPLIGNEEEQEVLEALRSNWISGGGSKTSAFEEAMRDFLGSSLLPLATVNGTGALQLAMRALNVSPGEHVLVSAYGFVASANCVRYAGAEPIFIGPEKGDFPVVTLSQVEQFLTNEVDGDCRFKRNGRPFKGMIYNQPYGLVDRHFEKICALFRERGLFLLEDASQSLGVKHSGKWLGTLGTVGVFSFNGNKTISTGTGGLLVAQDDQLLATAKRLRHQSRSDPFDFFYDESGYNLLMSNVLGALGLAQVKRLPEILENKRKIRSIYRSSLVKSEFTIVGADLPDFPAWLNVVLLPKAVSSRAALQELATKMASDGFQIRPAFPAVTDCAMYRDSLCFDGGELQEFFMRAVCLPSGPGVSESQATQIVSSLARHTEKLGLA